MKTQSQIEAFEPVVAQPPEQTIALTNVSKQPPLEASNVDEPLTPFKWAHRSTAYWDMELG